MCSNQTHFRQQYVRIGIFRSCFQLDTFPLTDCSNQIFLVEKCSNRTISSTYCSNRIFLIAKWSKSDGFLSTNVRIWNFIGQIMFESKYLTSTKCANRTLFRTKMIESNTFWSIFFESDTFRLKNYRIGIFDGVFDALSLKYCPWRLRDAATTFFDLISSCKQTKNKKM